jgi:carbamoyltransferase
MYILGINCAYHESAACLIHDGDIIAAAEEERFTRRKHAKRPTTTNADDLPLQAIMYCMKQAGLCRSGKLNLSAISHIGYSLEPERRFAKNRSLSYDYPLAPRDFGTPEGEEEFKASIEKVAELVRELGFRGSFQYLEHHLCHAASSYFMCRQRDAAVLVIDGIGEFESATLFHGQGDVLSPIYQDEYPNSLGLLWEKLSCYLGYTEYDSGKVMALAAYGDHECFVEDFARFARAEPNITVNDSIVRMRSQDHRQLEELFGLERRSSPIEHLDRSTRQYANVAAALQEFTDRSVIHLAEKARSVGSKNLCLSGGVALNCSTVGKLLRSTLFDSIYVPYAAHDAGTALGAALLIASKTTGIKCRATSFTPYIGPDISAEEVERACDAFGVPRMSCLGQTIEERAAQLIADGNVVGWCHGRMEFGPRALGHRSLLADPRSMNSVRKLRKIKNRNPFDPFSPSILREEVGKWFTIPASQNLSDMYMAACYPALPGRADEIPAVVHVDGTSRVQAVDEDFEPRYYRLISEFYALTGVPMLLNTSFNEHEPIVCTAADAISTAIRAEIDYLVLGDWLVEIRCGSPVPEMKLEDYFEKLR